MARRAAAWTALVVTVGALSPVAAQPGASKASIRGIVFDSLVGRAPLVGATVEILELARTARTDQRGVFRFDSLVGGRYTVSFSHPSLTAVGFSPPERMVELGSGIDLQLFLATPSEATLYSRFCRGPREERTGIFLGTLSDAGTGQALVGEVRGEWTVTTLSREAGFVQRPRIVRATTDSGGRFQLCGIPTDIPVLLRAAAGGVDGPVLELRLENQPFKVRHLSLDIAGTPGQGRVVGAVTGGGAGLADAQVLILGSNRIVKTSADGSFELTGLPAGSHTIEARAIGYQRRRADVELRADRAAEIRLDLTQLAVELPELTVTAPPGSSGVSGFDQRRQFRTGGHFITREEIVRRGSVRVEDVVRTVPGIKVVPAGLTDYRILSTRGGSGLATMCEPTVFIDDMRIPLDPESGLNLPLGPDEVYGIEVHLGPGSAPIQYQSMGKNCGVILIWTRRGRR